MPIFPQWSIINSKPRFVCESWLWVCAGFTGKKEIFMLTQYLIASILIAFLLTCDIFILVHPHLSLKKYPIFFFSFSALFYIQIYFTFYPMLFVILGFRQFNGVDSQYNMGSLSQRIKCWYIIFNHIWHFYISRQLSHPLSGQTIFSKISYWYFWKNEQKAALFDCFNPFALRIYGFHNGFFFW